MDKMQIKDLEVRQGNVDIIVEIIEVGDAREFTKFGRSGKVATAKAKDDTGEINLSLWNEQVDMVKPGMKIHVVNGYVNEFQGEKQLTTGKFGKLEAVGESSGESSEEGGSSEKETVEEKPSVDEENIEE